MKLFLTHTEEMFRLYYGEVALRALAEHAEIVRNTSGRVLDGAALAEAAQGCAVIVADRTTPGHAATFDAAPELVAFLRCAVDVSTIDLAAASGHGILVTRATPGFVDSVSELAIGMLIDLARGITAKAEAAHLGRVPELRPGRQLAGATLGLIGYGRIAQRLARAAMALGMRVIASDPQARPETDGVPSASFPDLLAASDFVVCLATSTEATRDLMDAAAFARMRPGACFLNLARGELVDEAALAAALDSGHIAGAALDVGRAADQRPSPGLAARPDVIATPHIGGLTDQATLHQAMDTVGQVAALAAGRLPMHALNAASATRLERLGIQGLA